MAPTTPRLTAPLSQANRSMIINYLKSQAGFDFNAWWASLAQVLMKHVTPDQYIAAGNSTWAVELDYPIISQYHAVQKGKPNPPEPAGGAAVAAAVGQTACGGGSIGQFLVGKPLDNFFCALLQKKTWIRVGEFTVGILVVGVATNAILRQQFGRKAPQFGPPKVPKALKFTPAGRAVSRTRTARFRE